MAMSRWVHQQFRGMGFADRKERRRNKGDESNRGTLFTI